MLGDGGGHAQAGIVLVGDPAGEAAGLAIAGASMLVAIASMSLWAVLLTVAG